MVKKNWLLIGSIFVGLILFVSLFFGLFPRGSDSVSDITDVPYAGYYLKDFKVEGDIKYAYMANHRGEATVYFSGVTSEEEFREFFGEEVGGKIRPEFDDGRQQWLYRLKDMKLDPNDYPVGTSEDNIRGFKAVGRAYIEVHYIKKDGRFTGRVLTGLD